MPTITKIDFAMIVIKLLFVHIKGEQKYENQ